MKYLSIDVETTGLNPNTDQILSVAAIVEDTCRPEIPIEELPTFHCYLVPRDGKIVGDIVAISMNVGILNKIQNRLEFPNDKFIYPSELNDRLSTFLFANEFDGLFHLTAAGKNVISFDIPFLNNYCGLDKVIKFHHRHIDPTVFYWEPKTDQTLPNLKTCCKRAGITMETEHDALEDARTVIKLIRNYYS